MFDPMFNRKMFAACTVGLAALFACLCCFRAEEEPAAVQAEEKPTPTAVASPSESDAPRVTDYERGYMSGFLAFQKQFGVYVPAEQNIPKGHFYSYTSHKDDEDSDEETKGYVDGYHRASAMIHCPASASGPSR